MYISKDSLIAQYVLIWLWSGCEVCPTHTHTHTQRTRLHVDIRMTCGLKCAGCSCTYISTIILPHKGVIFTDSHIMQLLLLSAHGEDGLRRRNIGLLLNNSAFWTSYCIVLDSTQAQRRLIVDSYRHIVWIDWFIILKNNNNNNDKGQDITVLLLLVLFVDLQYTESPDHRSRVVRDNKTPRIPERAMLVLRQRDRAGVTPTRI